MNTRFFSLSWRILICNLLFCVIPVFCFFVWGFFWKEHRTIAHIQSDIVSHAKWRAAVFENLIDLKLHKVSLLCEFSNLWNNDDAHLYQKCELDSTLKLLDETPKIDGKWLTVPLFPNQMAIAYVEPTGNNLVLVVTNTLSHKAVEYTVPLASIDKFLLSYQTLLRFESITLMTDEAAHKVQAANVIILPLHAINLNLVVAYNFKEITAGFLKYFWALIGVLLLTKLVSIVILLWLSRRISAPLRQLFVVMRQISQGNTQVRYKSDPLGYEINPVGETFNEMVDKLIDQIECARRDRLKKQTLLQEFQIAHHIQLSILPAMPTVPGIDLAATIVPARQVGGDFYDVYLRNHMPDAPLILTIGDSAGKGVSACLYTVCLRSMLRSYQAEYEEITKQLQLTNALYFHDAEYESMFTTLFTALYYPKSKILRFSSAGHPPALLLRNGVIFILDTNGHALGITEELHIEMREFQLQSNDLLLLYTDGVTDMHNPSKMLFGEQRLEEFLKGNGALSAEEFANRLIQTLSDFAGDQPQFDDITYLVMRVE